MPDPILNIVLHQPEIPFNAGNCGRTCVAIGAKLWLVRPLGFQVDDRHVRRAGLDYWQHLDWEAVDDWETLVSRLPGRRYWFMTKTAARHYTEIAFEPGDVLVFGSESRGLPPAMLEGRAESCLRIPMHTKVRSLNLSVSMAVVAYEAMRQWRVRSVDPGFVPPITPT
jgi:tRNA (cytidine/uridine-2'-O-)-methyltransferase